MCRTMEVSIDLLFPRAGGGYGQHEFQRAIIAELDIPGHDEPILIAVSKNGCGIAMVDVAGWMLSRQHKLDDGSQGTVIRTLKPEEQTEAIVEMRKFLPRGMCVTFMP